MDGGATKTFDDGSTQVFGWTAKASMPWAAAEVINGILYVAGGNTLLHIFSVTLFEKMPLQQAFPSPGSTSADDEAHNQYELFDS